MKILVLNCGSSSVKFQLLETDAESARAGTDRALAKGLVENIGGTAVLKFEVPGRGSVDSVPPEPGMLARSLDWKLTTKSIGAGSFPARQISKGTARKRWSSSSVSCTWNGIASVNPG